MGGLKLPDSKFRLFRDEVSRSLRLLGLSDWNVNVLKGPVSKGAAECLVSDAGKQADIVVNEIMPEASDIDADIRDSARHEAAELLLSRLCEMAEARDWNRKSFITEKHAVINRINKLLGMVPAGREKTR